MEDASGIKAGNPSHQKVRAGIERAKGFKMKWWIVLMASLAIIYFSPDAYRYPCQDPNNWSNDECKPPICIVNQSCPEYFEKDGLQRYNARGTNFPR
jgi:hypothetical protein